MGQPGCCSDSMEMNDCHQTRWRILPIATRHGFASKKRDLPPIGNQDSDGVCPRNLNPPQGENGVQSVTTGLDNRLA